ncbi:Sulfite exporter TauE/SafE [Corynebacterium kalinowskii]|uniref:Probable membrane transporter protein n=1 Tax=Corynebacterium kalinowskii TaxID=2675216 RepID=A0A6B8VK79_9CORY|nr:sulfite exporter TauE/SafE family protein [Corynebacterium kalinowskii]QGU01874.1 Sulfite exporter TauE/SafE [Corynebacterium kalinowskii]
MALLILILFIVALGSGLQRVAGMGLGLIAAPVLAIAMGPVQGVMVVNILAMVNAAMTGYTVREHIDWRRCFYIGSVMVFGAIAGALLIKQVSNGLLLILFGTLILIALFMVSALKGRMPEPRGRIPMLVTGVVGGFTNTLAAVAGPVITVYAQAARWDHRSFAATLQPLFVISGGMSFLIKSLLGAGNLGATSPWVWPVGLLGMFIGIYLGTQLSKIISRDRAHKLALLLAGAGGLSALVRGALAL